MARTVATMMSPSRRPSLVGVRADLPCPASDLRASGRERRHEGGPPLATPASRRAPKADKRRTEGGSDRPISAPSMWIVCHEALRAGPVERSWPVGQTLSERVSPNTEGGQTADGRWNPPTNFGRLVGDLLDMRNSASMPRPQLSATIGGRLWPRPHEGTVALEAMGS